MRWIVLALASLFRSKASLVAENLGLRQQLAMDPRCAPQWVLGADPPDQSANFDINTWSSGLAARFVHPQQPKACPMPAHDRR